MGASGYWATEMFAIFSGLHDSIQASRLILRAPTVSPSIRNMYNSAVCFPPLLSLSKHTLVLWLCIPMEAFKERGKKGSSAQGTERKEGCRQLFCFFFHTLSQSGFLKRNKTKQKQHLSFFMQNALTDSQTWQGCQLNHHQHRFCLAHINLSFPMASVAMQTTTGAWWVQHQSTLVSGYLCIQSGECLRGTVEWTQTKSCSLVQVTRRVPTKKDIYKRYIYIYIYIYIYMCV